MNLLDLGTLAWSPELVDAEQIPSHESAAGSRARPSRSEPQECRMQSMLAARLARDPAPSTGDGVGGGGALLEKLPPVVKSDTVIAKVVPLF